MSSSLDIGIVGAGFGGLAAAAYLARDGHRVTLYERATQPGPVGAAIVLQPSGLAVLRDLGVDALLDDRAARLDRLHVTNPRGRVIVDLHYRDLDPDWYGLGIGRGVLFEALWTASQAAGAQVLSGRTAVALSFRRDARRLHFADGASADHQLVVIADGARSTIANEVAPRRVVPYAWGALFFVGPSDDTNVLHQVGRGTRRFVGVLPMGGGRASLFWSLRADGVAAWRERFDDWRDECRAMCPRAQSLLDAMRGPGDMLFAPYFDVQMPRWHGERAVVIGDAAHATSPQLGQGSNLALIDAHGLALCLRASRAARRGDPAEALAAYSQFRAGHLSYYQRATRWLTPFFQHDLRAIGVVRDLLMPLVGKLGPFRRLMTRSMAGTAAGFLGGHIPLVTPWPGSRPGRAPGPR